MIIKGEIKVKIVPIGFSGLEDAFHKDNVTRKRKKRQDCAKFSSISRWRGYHPEKGVL
jgi:hypothetical protein